MRRASPEDGRESRRRAVCLRFADSERFRLRRREPDCCADGRPIWSERPLLIARADGTLYLMGASSHLHGLARWVLSFAGDAEVESPPALRRILRAAALQIATRYDTPPDDRWLQASDS